MKSAVLCLSLLSFILSVRGQTINEWEQLFGGDTSKWTTRGDEVWSFRDSELKGSAGKEMTGYMITRDSYRDFHLLVEFFPDSSVNSGVFIRCGDSITSTDCYEINIWDNHPNQENRTGAVVGLVKPLNRVETIGQWNTYEVKAEGNLIRAWVNGIQVVSLTDSRLSEGTIAVQAASGGTIKFRNIKVKVR